MSDGNLADRISSAGTVVLRNGGGTDVDHNSNHHPTSDEDNASQLSPLHCSAPASVRLSQSSRISHPPPLAPTVNGHHHTNGHSPHHDTAITGIPERSARELRRTHFHRHTANASVDTDTDSLVSPLASDDDMLTTTATSLHTASSDNAANRSSPATSYVDSVVTVQSAPCAARPVSVTVDNHRSQKFVK